MSSANLEVKLSEVLDYQTVQPWIYCNQLLRDRSYNRTWWFRQDEENEQPLSLSDIQDQSWTKMALYLDTAGTNSNHKMHLVTNNYTADARNFSAWGTASLQSSGSAVWQTGEWYVGKNYTFNVEDYSSYSILEGTYVQSNVPIFQTYAEAVGYVQGTVDISEALNYTPVPVVHEGEDFELVNVWTHGTWTQYGLSGIGEKHFRNVRGRILEGGRICTYDVSGITDGALIKRVVASANFESLEYSIDGVTWIPTDTFPFEYIYRQRVNELGTFDYALTDWTDLIPNFDNEEDGTDYIQGRKPIDEANNWDKISPNYPPSTKNGDPENQTEFGEVYTRAVFSQLYFCNFAAIQEIAGALFDYDVTTLSGLWEDIKKGLEMYGTNPMEVVQGLRFYPFDLSQYFTSTSSQNYIYFGAYQLQLQDSSVKKVIYANGYIDLGTLPFERWYKDWRDFEPYTKISIYLPYVGTFPLDAKKYYGKTVKIRYFIDLRTGACTACLLANNVLLDYFDGIIGTEMPITLTDYSSYAQSQLNIIMRNAGIGIASEGTVGNVAAQGMGMALNYNENAQAIQEAALMSPATSSLAAQTAGSYGTQAIAAAAVGGTALVGAVAVGTVAKTSFDLMRNGTAGYTKTRPASSSMINQYLPQYPYLRTEIMEIDESPYLNELYGRPSNASGRIGEFSGFLQVEDVMLICPIATDNERQEIIDLLRTGIYI